MSRPRRRGERGQIIPLLALTIFTMGAMAMVAITFGQAMVRRQQAQMVVDAAAFAGAAEEAKGLNTIARINEKEYNTLNAITMSRWETVYVDNDSTTKGRFYWYDLTNDWAEDMWEDFQPQVFDRLNKSIDQVNFAYRPMGLPRKAARKIIDENFGGSDRIFHDENPEDHGVVLWVDDMLSANLRLVQLTDPKDYEVGGIRVYAPSPTFSIPVVGNVLACNPGPYCVNVPCCAAKADLAAAYFAANAYFMGRALAGSHPTYQLGKFYNNNAYKDVHFTYYLRVPSAGPIVAKSFFNVIPPIEVMASAKPYRGHLGAEYESSWSSSLYVGQYDQQSNKEHAFTYVAKLIPIRTLEKRAGWLFYGGGGLDAFQRFMSTIH